MAGKPKRDQANTADEKARIRNRIEELRLSGIRNQRQIASILDISASTVNTHLKEIAKDWEEAAKEKHGAVVAHDIALIERGIRALYPQYARGDTRSVASMVKLMERRSKLLGLDAPEKREITGSDGGPIAMEHDLAAQLRATVERIASEEGVDPDTLERDVMGDVTQSTGSRLR